MNRLSEFGFPIKYTKDGRRIICADELGIDICILWIFLFGFVFVFVFVFFWFVVFVFLCVCLCVNLKKYYNNCNCMKIVQRVEKICAISRNKTKV